MNDPDWKHKVWSCKTIIAMTRIVQNSADPDAVIEDWFDQAGEEDESDLMIAIGMWRHIRTLNSQDLEFTRANAEQMLLNLGSRH